MIKIAASLYVLSQPFSGAALPSPEAAEEVAIIAQAGVATGQIGLRLVILPHAPGVSAAVPNAAASRPAPYRRDVLKQGQSTVIIYYQ